MRSKRSSTLSLNSKDRRRKLFLKPKSIKKWTKSTHDVFKSCFSRPEASPIRPMPPFRLDSPAMETTKKRPGSISPYVSVKSPFKRTPSKQPSAKKMRKCLFNNTPTKSVRKDDNCSSEKLNSPSYGEDLGDLWASILDKLKEKDLDGIMLEFFRMIKDGQFPLDNMAFQLFTDVIKWYSCKSTCEMRYSRQSKIFWKLGYRLFGGRFLHFMGGMKNFGHVVLDKGKKGNLDPLSSEINFAVPSPNVLRNFDPYSLQGNNENDRPFAPGILDDMIESVANELKDYSCCLTFDGKKLKQGLTQNSGDVDLLGCGPGLSLVEKRKKHLDTIQPFQVLSDMVDSIDENISIDNVRSDDKKEIQGKLRQALKDISIDKFEARVLKKKKEYAKQKNIDTCGEPDWKNSRYVMAISSMIAYIHDIDEYLDMAKNVINEILLCLTCVNETSQHFMQGNTINLTDCTTYQSIPDEDNSASTNIDTRGIKQRTDTWFNRRKNAKITGSSMFAAVGLDGLGKQQEHFETVICGSKKKPFSDKVAGYLAYGTENETNATATLVGKVLPVLFSNRVCCEEGFVEMDEYNGNPFIVVSPDGSIRKDTNMDSTEVAVELKCPVMDIHTCIPVRYVLQCQAEINALNVESLVYVCWRPDVSSVFIVKRHDQLYGKAYKFAETLYKTETPKRMKCLSEELKQLKIDVNEASKSEELSEFVGIFPSLIQDKNAAGFSEPTTFKMIRLQHLISQILKVFETKQELMREKATEAVVFLCSALERDLNSKSVTAPVCWFTKVNSLDCLTMRKILENVMCKCHEAGLHVPAISFDGQWHNISVRDDKNGPLTKLQLQKDVWRKAESMKKQTILAELRAMNKETVLDKATDNKTNKVKYHLIGKSRKKLPSFSQSVIEQRKIDQAAKDKKESERLESINEQSNDQIDNEVICDLQVSQEDEPETELIDREQLPDKDNVSETDNEEKDNSATSVMIDDTDVEIVDTEKAGVILKMLQTDDNCNKKGIWNDRSKEHIVEVCKSVEKLKNLREVDLRVIVRFFKKQGNRKLKESDTKANKLLNLFEILGLKDDTSSIDSQKKKRRHKIKPIKSLKEIAFAEVSKYRKSDLNIIYAEYMWPEKLSEWQNNAPFYKTELYLDTEIENNSGIFDNVHTEDINNNTIETQPSSSLPHENGQTDESGTSSIDTLNHQRNKNVEHETTETLSEFFYIPANSQKRHQYEVSCIDSSHLLTRTRRKCCKGGLASLPNEPWRKVAKSGNTNLSVGMIDCVIDQMSVSTAVAQFSETVENEMRKNGDTDAADLCKDIRSWWRAEDEPGLSAHERLKMRLALRKRLLCYVNFSHFPPPGMYIRGWPSQLWEALIANIDAKTLLYKFSKQKTYNTRAFSSLVGETFFSELTQYDRRGQGTVTSAEFESFIGTTVEKMHMRFDTERQFVYRTCRKTVYKLMDEQDFKCSGEGDAHSGDIILNDHLFDVEQRARVKGRKREETISKNRNAVLRGSLGVRWEKARRNDSKIWPTTRMGIDM